MSCSVLSNPQIRQRKIQVFVESSIGAHLQNAVLNTKVCLCMCMCVRVRVRACVCENDKRIEEKKEERKSGRFVFCMQKKKEKKRKKRKGKRKKIERLDVSLILAHQVFAEMMNSKIGSKSWRDWVKLD